MLRVVCLIVSPLHCGIWGWRRRIWGWRRRIKISVLVCVRAFRALLEALCPLVCAETLLPAETSGPSQQAAHLHPRVRTTERKNNRSSVSQNKRAPGLDTVNYGPVSRDLPHGTGHVIVLSTSPIGPVDLSYPVCACLSGSGVVLTGTVWTGSPPRSIFGYTSGCSGTRRPGAEARGGGRGWRGEEIGRAHV